MNKFSNSKFGGEDILRIRGMRFFAYQGAYPEEKSLGGQLLVDLALRGDFSIENTDDNISRTVNLAEVYDCIEDLIIESKYNLIETLAEKIADIILERFDISEVTVTVRKEAPPIPGIVEAIEAVITRAK
jgi:dihydroneopterin aldolase